MATTTQLLTAEEFWKIDDDRPSELVEGRIVEMNMPSPEHGQVCGEVCYVLMTFVKKHDLGHVVANDTGVITKRNPDTVRGTDVAYYSYARVPKGRLPKSYLDIPPDAVFEVRSPTDRPGAMKTKIAEYLAAGVRVVVAVDPESETVKVHYPNQPPQTLAGDEVLTLSDVLEGFRVSIREFFPW